MITSIRRALLLALFFPISLAALERPNVGVILPLSGEAASYGEQFRQGIQTNPQASQFNLVFEDSKFDPNVALNAFNKLIDVDHISLLISFGGATCQVLNDRAQHLKLLHIAAGCNTAEFVTMDSVNFRLDVNESIAAAKTASFLKSNGYGSIALLYVNNPWGGTIIDYTKKALTQAGLKVTIDIPFDKSQAGELRTSLLKLRQSKPDVIFLISLPHLTPLVLKQLREQRITVPIMSNISVENPEVIRLAGRDADGIFYLSVKSDGRSLAAQPQFFAAFSPPSPFAAWGFDSISLISHASTEKIPYKALQQLRDYVGAFNAYTFDSHGEVHLKYEIRAIRDGQYVWKSDVN